MCDGGVFKKKWLSLHVSLFLLCRCFFVGITLSIHNLTHTNSYAFPL